MSDWHVYPVADLIEHETEGDGCPCGPSPDPVKAGDGSVTWVLIHHSLDSREHKERAV